jgi:hypothetical protein
MHGPQVECALSITEFLKMSFFPDTVYSAHDLARWGLAGAPVPPPPIVKQLQLASYVKGSGYQRFVETGTYLGWTTNAIASFGVEVDTIELAELHYNRAITHFGDNPKIRCFFGDSTTVLPQILSNLHEPAVFWLDGHFSGGDTAMGATATPVAEELEALAAHPIKGHIVLVDDIRGFGENGYPTKEWVMEIGARIVPDCEPILLNDSLIFATPEMHQRARDSVQSVIDHLLP